jgi:hypothetical protein
MRFEKDKLMEYVSNDLTFVQKFAEQAYKLERLDKHDLFSGRGPNDRAKSFWGGWVFTPLVAGWPLQQMKFGPYSK